MSIDGQKRSGKIRVTNKKGENVWQAFIPLSGLKVQKFGRAKISMQKPIYLLFSGARQLFLFNCYRAREGNMLEEEKSLLSFSPRVRARVLETSPFALKTGTC